MLAKTFLLSFLSTCHLSSTSGTENAQLFDHLRTEDVEISEEVTFESFVSVDSGVITTAELSDSDIAAIVRRGQGETENVDASELDDSSVPPPPPTATKSLQVLKRH